jgi:hypothetical protein
MVKADSRRSDKLYTTPLKQFTVTAGAGADNKRLRVSDNFGGKRASRDIDHLGIRLQDASEEWYGVIYNNFHIAKVI